MTEPVLHLAGVPRLSAGDAPLRTSSRRALAMAVVLALEGECARDRLADLLWPGTDRAVARRNLRRDLFRLRELGLPLIDRGRDAVAMRPLAIAWPEPNGDAPLWLHGLDAAGGAELADWLQDWRVRLHRQWLADLAARAEALEREGDDAAALRLWQALLGDDLAGPDHEPARRAFGRLRRHLPPSSAAPQAPARPPVGATPARAAPASSSGAPTPRLPARPPFVPRAALQSRIVDAARAGRVVFVAGAAGAGKTRLALEAAATLGGALHVRCRPEDADDPFSSALRLLDMLREAAPDVALPRWVRRELASLVPEWAEDPAARAERPPPSPLPMKRAFEMALQALARDNFAAVVLDDWQWADPASLALWHLDAAPDAACPLARIVVHRSGELPAPALERRRALLDAERAVAIQVPDLDAAELLALVRSLAGEGGGERFAARLHRATGGNPLFVLETLRHLFDIGVLDIDGRGRWRTPFDAVTEDYSELAVAPSVHDAVIGRARALGTEVRRLLEVASLAGSELTPSLLAPPAGLDELATADALDHAVAAGFLVAGRTPGSPYRFAHDLLAQALAESLSPARRQALHARLAEQLAALDGAPGHVAQHWEGAGRAREAAEWHRRAGRSAEQRGAPQEALRHYAVAVQGLADPEQRTAVHLASAVLHRARNDMPAVAAAYERALQDAAQVDRTRMLDVMLSAVSDRVLGGQAAAALAELDAIACDPALASAQRQTLQVQRSRALNFLGRHAEARQTLETLLAELPPSAIGKREHVNTQLAFTLMSIGALADAERTMRESLRLCRLIGDDYRTASAMGNLAGLTREIGLADESERLAQEVRELSRRAGFTHLHQAATYSLVALLTDRGRAAEAERLIDQAIGDSPYWADARLRQMFLEARCYVHLLRGHREPARAAAQAALDGARSGGDPYLLAGALRLVFDLYMALGEHEVAAALLAEAEGLLERIGSVSLRRQEFAVRALQLAQAQGNRADALARLQASMPALESLRADDRARWLAAALHTAVDAGHLALAAELRTRVGTAAGAAIEERAGLHAALLRLARATGEGVDDAVAAARALLADPHLPRLQAESLERSLAAS